MWNIIFIQGFLVKYQVKHKVQCIHANYICTLQPQHMLIIFWLCKADKLTLYTDTFYTDNVSCKDLFGNWLCLTTECLLCHVYTMIMVIFLFYNIISKCMYQMEQVWLF